LDLIILEEGWASGFFRIFQVTLGWDYSSVVQHKVLGSIPSNEKNLFQVILFSGWF
jgi:hypothetical protein